MEKKLIRKEGKTFKDILLQEDWQYPARVVRIRVEDVIRYYAYDARNIT